jgi:cytoskeletal protein CcmA (bactofilin family)
MPQLIDLGRIRFSFLGDYSSGTTYKVNDVVRYGANLYVYINASGTAGNVPTNATYWSSILSGFEHKGVYSSGTTYKIAETVTYSGSIYQVITSTTVGNLPTNVTYWKLILEGAFPEQTGLANSILETNGTATNWTATPNLEGLTVLGDTELKGDLVSSYRQVSVTNIGKSGNTVTATTSTPHLFDVGDTVVIAGISGDFNTSSTVATVPSSTTFTYSMSMSGTIASASVSGTATVYGNISTSGTITSTGDVVLTGGSLSVVGGNTSMTGTLLVSGATTISNDAVVKQALDVEGAFEVTGRTRDITHRALSGTTVTFTTNTPHALIVGDVVTTSGLVNTDYNFTKTVTAVPTTTTFTVTETISGGNVATTAASGTVVAKSLATFSSADITENLDVAGRAIVSTEFRSEGITLVGGSARDQYDTNGLVTKTITTSALTSNVVTITTSAAHGFSPYQFVEVTSSRASINGTFEIVAVPTSTTFTYDLTLGNLASAATTGTVETIPGFTNLMALFTSDANDDYSQVAVQNTAGGANVSSDFIAYPDNGTDFSGYIDMGITSSDFSDPEFTITGANDGYIFMTAPVGSTGNGNLVLATGDTGAENKIVFAAGGLSTNNTQMVITPDENIHIEIPTPSTSSSTGALTVVGGVGITGDMNIQGDVAIQGTITFGGGGTTVETSNLAVTDPIVFVGTNNQADTVDLSFLGEYQKSASAIVKTVSNKALTSNVATLTTSTTHGYEAGAVVVVTDVDATFNGTFNIIAVPTTTTFTYAKTAANVVSVAASGTATVSSTRKYSGLSRDASDGVFKLFHDAPTKPTTTVDFAGSGLTYSPLLAGNIQAVGNIVASGTSTLNGLVTADSLTVTGATQLNGTLTTSQNVSISGRLDVQEIREDVLDGTITSNVLTCDYSTGNIFYIATAPSANFTVNVTNAPTDNGKSISVTVVVTQGATGYISSALQVAGVAQTLKWANATAPVATNGAGKFDIFNFTLIRRSSAWLVLGSAVQNF